VSEVVTFERFRPPPRFDALPWTDVRVEESSEEEGTYAQIDTFALSPVDVDPENPAYRSFTTELGTAAGYWYRIIFADASGDVTAPSVPIQNLAGSVPSRIAAFVTVNELASILQVKATSNADALQRVLEAAAGEIVSETGRNDFTGWELSLVQQVNLARAEELWKQMKAPWGVIGTESEFGTTHLASDTFKRHALSLAPLKQEWGIA
jgi:hypothetical protein